jgi:hypothetical protein
VVVVIPGIVVTPQAPAPTRWWCAVACAAGCAGTVVATAWPVSPPLSAVDWLVDNVLL